MPSYYKRMRMGPTKIKGGQACIDAFNKKIASIKDQSLRALIRIQAKIYADMDSIPPVIPVYIGNLRRSYYAVTSNGAVIRGRNVHFYGVAAHKVGQESARKIAHKDDQDLLNAGHSSAIQEALDEARQIGETRGPAIVFGFSAYYAPYVHEMVGAKFKRAGAGAHFFTAAVKSNIRYASKIIRQEAKRYT